jgi:LacI family transcriptional regulator
MTDEHQLPEQSGDGDGDGDGRSVVAPAGGRRPVRLRDIADLVGVDVSTVSRVLNNSTRASVRPDTRRRILEAASRLGYQPNTAARSLKAARSMTIGLFVPSLFNVAYASIAAGADERASTTGYALTVLSGSVGERMAALNGRLDGLLLANATAESPLPPGLDPTLPVLLVNRGEAGRAPSLTVDDEAGSVTATDYLISLGHTRIAHAAGPQNTDTARRRRLGFVAALERAGIPLDERVIAEAPYTEAGGYASTLRLLALEPKPTAIVASTLTVAIGAMAAIRRSGLAIPGDVSIVGYDDVSLAAYLDPPLTTVRMPLREMGSHAVDMLIDLIAGRPVDSTRLDIPPELIVRASAAPPRHG